MSAMFGVFNTLHSFFHKYRPQSFIAAFDSRTPTFRHKLYDKYKATRLAAPDDLHAQVPWIEEVLISLGTKCLRSDGYEADDIIATIAAECAKYGRPCKILTGDKDLCALVNETTHLLRPLKKGEWQDVDIEAVKDEWGVDPAQITDLLALMGDTSDNIPGIHGVGLKTAAKYLCAYGTLESVLSHAGDVKGKAGEKLRAGADSARLSKQLVQLRYDVPIEGMQNIVKACGKDFPQDAQTFNYDALALSLEKYEQKTLAAKWRALKKEQDNTMPNDASRSSSSPLSFSCTASPSATYPLETNISLPPDIAISHKLLSVAAWMLESGKGKYDIKSLAEYEGMDAKDDAVSKRLWDIYCARLNEHSLMELFTSLELPLMSVLRKMERNGIHLDTAALAKYSEELCGKINTLEKEIYALCGREFNIGSPKQLSAQLYGEMGLVPAKRSTDAATLEALQDADPVVGKVLQWRELTKLRSTYLETLPRLVDEKSRVHTTFVQTGTATGRLSSRDPNLQNIPVRTDEGRRIRSAFTSPLGRMLISADYSQIELVVLAHLSGDENMKKSFMDGVDIHRTTAAMIFGTEDVTSEMRRTAKTINFGVIYGMSAFRLARDLGISRTEAAEFIKKYFEAYPAIQSFKAQSIQMARERGFVTTLMGRQRFVTGLDGGRMEREAAERIAVNTRVQGSAADIMKKAMLDVDKAITENKTNAMLLLQVHDELILECDDKEADKAAALVKDKMEKAVVLSVPLKVSVEIGKNWGEFH